VRCSPPSKVSVFRRSGVCLREEITTERGISPVPYIGEESVLMGCLNCEYILCCGRDITENSEENPNDKSSLPCVPDVLQIDSVSESIGNPCT